MIILNIRKKPQCFTLIEMIIVIVILGILLVSLIPKITRARDFAHLTAAKSDFNTMNTDIQLYLIDNKGEYPPDIGRNIPVGLGEYIQREKISKRPEGPRPLSIYDRDNIITPSQSPVQQYIQLSIRFCPAAGPLSACKFPNETRANGFDLNSSAYFCISGPCRSHSNRPLNHPGYCINC